MYMKTCGFEVTVAVIFYTLHQYSITEGTLTQNNLSAMSLFGQNSEGGSALLLPRVTLSLVP